MLRIARLAGAFTGGGFRAKRGRHPQTEDCGFMRGPIDILCDTGAGEIVAIARHDEYPVARQDRIVDGSNLFATAGFIDSHTHAIHGGQRANEHFLRWQGTSYAAAHKAGGGIHRTVAQTRTASDEDLIRLLRERLDEMLACGTTVVEVKSGYADSPAGELRLLRLIAKACAGRQGPVVRSTLLGLHALPRSVREEDYCSAMINILDDVVAEGLAQHADAFPEVNFFSLGQSLRFVRAAQERGLRPKVHADQITDAGASLALLEEHALSIDHLERINASAVNRFATSETVGVLLPTASFYMNGPYADARRLIDAGARIALASDFNPGSAPALDLQLANLLAASQLKMTAAEILCACTYNGAVALGMEDTCGTLEPGRSAHILLWDTFATHRLDDGSDVLQELLVRRAKPAMVFVHGCQTV
jgi:imidazolonepropionase